MTPALTPPTMPTVMPEFGIDRVIYILQHSLAIVSGIQYSLGRIKPQTVNKRLEPWIQIGQSREYYRAYPNDTLMNFTALYAHDDEHDVGENILFERTLSVIGWFNLSKLPAGKDLEFMKRAVRHNLKDYCSSVVKEFGVCRDQTATGSSGIYPGFDLTGFEEKYLTAPFGGFRLELTVMYADLCYTQPEPDISA